MVTESVNIRFVESGARVIKRRIDDIGESANRATRGIFLLQRALFVLGGAGIARVLQRSADALTNMENRLRLTTDSTAQLEAVQSELFNVVRRSRSDLANTADLYNRIALSARNLGVGQRQILAVTQTLQQAAILSGASAREANLALVQLGQGIASDRLSGDELRSVLEQLPAVADIIVDYLNDVGTFGEVTRGTLRELGKESKLTAEIVFRAIEASQSRIARLFAETQPTIEQSFNVAKANFLEFLDVFDDATGASAAIARLIIKVSENFDILLAAILAVAAALTGLFAAKVVASISAYITKLQIAGGAFARLRAIQASSAAAQAASTAAIAADTRARVTNLTAITTRSAAQVRSAQLEFVEATAAFQNGRARDVLTGRFIANQIARDRLTAASIRLANAERVNLALTGRLASARTASIAADNAAAAAATRAAAAQAARGSILARLSATFPLLAGAARLAASAISALFAIIVANPISALITAIVAAGIAIFTFGDRIKVTADGVVSLKDAAIAAFQLIGEAIAPVTNFLKRAFGESIDFVSNSFSTVFPKILRVVGSAIAGIIDTLTFIPRVVIGIVAGIIAAWNRLPAALGSVIDLITDFFATGFENIANLGIRAANEIIEAFNSLAQTRIGKLLELTPEEPLKNISLDNLRTNFGGSGQTVGEAFTTAFNNAVENGKVRNILNRFSEAILKRARQNIANAETTSGQITDSEINQNSSDINDGNTPDFASQLAELQQRIELEKQFGIQKEITNNILKTEKSIKRELTTVEAEQIATATRLVEISKIQGEVLEEIFTPAQKLALAQEALNELFKAGAINLRRLNEELRKFRIEALNAEGTFSGGFKATLLDNIKSATELGQTFGNIVVGGINEASKALADFIVDGEKNFSSFIRNINKQIIQLVASQAFTKLASGFASGSFGSNFFGSLGDLLKFQNGGSFKVGANTSVASIPNGGNDNRLVLFRAQDGETVSVTPRNQKPGGNTQNIVVNFNITTPDVESFRRSESQLASRAAKIISRGQRNL